MTTYITNIQGRHCYTLWTQPLLQNLASGEFGSAIMHKEDNQWSRYYPVLNDGSMEHTLSEELQSFNIKSIDHPTGKELIKIPYR